MRHLNLIDKAFLLKKTALFHLLDLDLLLSIADKMELMTYQPTAPIFRCNQEAYQMYLVVTGQVTILADDQSHLAHLHAGDFFGDEALFHEGQRKYTATCATKVEVLALSRSHLTSIIHECPSVALALLEAYSSKINFRPR